MVLISTLHFTTISIISGDSVTSSVGISRGLGGSRILPGIVEPTLRGRGRG